jgi:hypothetical protein
MKLYLAAVVLFLAAFAGLAAGLLLRRKGLRGGCSPATGSGRDCQCRSVADSGRRAGTERPAAADDCRAPEGCPASPSPGEGPATAAGEDPPQGRSLR